MKSMKNTMKCLVAVFIMAMAFAVTGITAEAAVTNMKQTYDTSSSVKVSFTTVSGQKYYGVQAATDAAFTNVVYQDWEINSSGSVITKEVYVSGLNEGCTYYVRIGYGSSTTTCYTNWSSAIEVVTSPSDLTTLKWINSNDTQVAIQFYAPGANWYEVYNADKISLGQTQSTAVAITTASPYGYYYVQPLRVSSTG